MTAVALKWLENLGYEIVYDPDIAFSWQATERARRRTIQTFYSSVGFARR